MFEIWKLKALGKNANKRKEIHHIYEEEPERRKDIQPVVFTHKYDDGGIENKEIYMIASSIYNIYQYIHDIYIYILDGFVSLILFLRDAINDIIFELFVRSINHANQRKL